MTRLPFIGAAVAVALLASAVVDPAAAASAVTFVSGLGRDGGACARATPCRTFRYAITQTTPGGVIAAIDRGGFGAVTITQSVTIVGPGGGVGANAVNRANGGTSIDIEAPGGTVVLRGLAINGGFNGINIGQAASVAISDTVVTGSSNLAIYAADTSASVLVQDTDAPDGPIDTQAATFVAKRVTVSGRILRTLGGHAVFDDCTISGAFTSDVGLFAGTTILKHGVFASAAQRGISVETNATVYLDRTTTFGNVVGIDTVGTTFSYGNNNFPDGTGGTITPIAGD